MTCPGCGRGVKTVPVQGGWAIEIHRKVADTADRREMHREDQ
jgi:hypothetical protein